MKVRWLLEAAGVALLVMLQYFYPLVLPYNIALYHHRLPLRGLGGGLLLDLFVAFVLGVLAIAAISRLPDVPRRIAAAGIIGYLFWRCGNLFFDLVNISHSSLVTTAIPHASDFYMRAVIFWITWGRTIAIVLFLALLLLALFLPDYSCSVTRAVRLGLAGFAFCALWILPTLVYASFAPQPQRAFASARTDPASGRRVIWILFDELSYDLLFDHRPEGMSFPNFDGLRSTSYSFGNLQPAGFFTDRIIPSILTGQQIYQIRSGKDGTLSYLDESQHRWIDYDPDKSLFAMAQANNWNPGVAGWYNPYCRIFSTVLTECHWRPGIPDEIPIETRGASESNSALTNALILPRGFISSHSGKAGTAPGGAISRNIQDYSTIMKQGVDLIHDDHVHFLFIHVPAPHPPGMYDRKAHRLRESGNYLDNMVLADDSLGLLMHEIDGTPDSAQTTVIVSSDHSWRVPIWKLVPGWTDEEQRISQGRFDPRPVLLIHFPGQSSASEVHAPMPELAEHDIIAAMLQYTMSSPGSLNSFLRSSIQRPGL